MTDTLARERSETTEPIATSEATSAGVLAWVTSTDHKRIGVSYMVTSFAFFLFGGTLALIMRAELWEPDLQFVDASRYAELFTMHGSIMMFLFLGPFAFGLANYFVPLHIGAHDMAFPRLNALSYWLFLGGGLTMVSGFATADGAADFGWFAYPPLALERWSPSIGGELWLVGVLLAGFSGVFTAVNVLTTVLTMRAPGMTMFRLPIFTWNMTVVSVLVLMAFPVVTAAGFLLFAERHFGLTFFDPLDGGSPLIWQHLFWFFGHPEVYILALPFFGIITEVIATFSRRPLFGYLGFVLATFAIAALSMGVWAHHMFVTGAVLLPFFSAVTVLIAVPTGIKIFNWIGTMWGGRIRFTTSMLFAIGFLLSFTLGGISGVQLGVAPVDFQASDTYFVVAHLHYVLVGGSVMALFSGIYYWFPKITGRLLSERLGRVHFVLSFIGVQATFLIQHQAGLNGMPRRVADYVPADGLDWMNQLSSVGASLLGVSVAVFLWNVWDSLRHGAPAGDDPWDGQTLEWATSSPPPPDNFTEPLPPIRSFRPVFDAKYGDHLRSPDGPTGRGRGPVSGEP